MHNFLPFLTYQSTFKVRDLWVWSVWSNFALGDNLKRFSSSAHLTMKICMCSFTNWQRKKERKKNKVNKLPSKFHLLFQGKIFYFMMIIFYKHLYDKPFLVCFYRVMQAYFRNKLAQTAHFPHIFCLMISFLSWGLFKSLHGNVSDFNMQSLCSRGQETWICVSSSLCSVVTLLPWQLGAWSLVRRPLGKYWAVQNEKATEYFTAEESCTPFFLSPTIRLQLLNKCCRCFVLRLMEIEIGGCLKISQIQVFGIFTMPWSS